NGRIKTEENPAITEHDTSVNLKPANDTVITAPSFSQSPGSNKELLGPHATTSRIKAVITRSINQNLQIAAIYEAFLPEFLKVSWLITILLIILFLLVRKRKKDNKKE
ncbi:MAG TPA: hypothetical protein P5056_01350, partial [Candidatus Paceibacterota bacterium]|nr:hypothetical protein [Candidatus Paceibacterota bacterium]